MLPDHMNHPVQMKDIAIFSGSFDPIHSGHAMVANYISQFCGIDEVWLMPSPINPLKLDAPPAPDHVRLEMCRLVARKCTGVIASDFEFALPKPSYTWRSLCALAEAYPDFRFSLVIGSDNWLCFDRWKNWRDIIANFRIIIYPRPGFPVEGELPQSVTLLEDAPQALISSTFVREGFRSGRNMNFFVPPEVNDYILKNRLYE